MPVAFLDVLSNNPWLIQLSVFGLIGAIAWLAVDWIGAGSSRAEQRLQDFKDPLARKRRRFNLNPRRAAVTAAKLTRQKYPTVSALIVGIPA